MVTHHIPKFWPGARHSTGGAALVGRLGAFPVALAMGLINTASAALSSSGSEVKK
jgi:hypothetical protein